MFYKTNLLKQFLFIFSLFLIACHSNGSEKKELSYKNFTEYGFYFLNIKIDDKGVIKGKSGYTPYNESDWWEGEVNGFLENGIIKGNYVYNVIDESYNHKINIILKDNIAIFKEENNEEILFLLETPDNINAPIEYLQYANKIKISSTFDSWLEAEIKNGKLSKPCPEIATKEFEQLIETYNDNNRWAYSDIKNIFYNDFNNDGIEDGLIVFNKEDCVQGGGYVGDPQQSIIFLSKGKNFTANSNILDRLKSKINKNAIGEFDKEVAYIEIEGIEDKFIIGKYYDWKAEDPTGQPSIEKKFKFNYKNNRLLIHD